MEKKEVLKFCREDILFKKNLTVYCDKTFCTQNTSKVLPMIEKDDTT